MSRQAWMKLMLAIVAKGHLVVGGGGGEGVTAGVVEEVVAPSLAGAVDEDVAQAVGGGDGEASGGAGVVVRRWHGRRWGRGRGGARWRSGWWARGWR